MLVSFSIVNFEVPFIYESLVFCLWLSHGSISFLLCLRILLSELFKLALLGYKFHFGAEELFWKIWDLYLYFALFISEVIAKKFPFFSGREDVVIIMSDDKPIYPFRMGFDFINLFGRMKGKLTIPDGSRPFFSCAIEENFLTVQESNFNDICIREYLSWHWNNVFVQLLTIWIPFFLFFLHNKLHTVFGVILTS